jgi:hypothetical protein
MSSNRDAANWRPRSAVQITAHLEQLRRQPPHLIGRGEELVMLRALTLDRRPVFVSGPAGVGKTALVQAVCTGWDIERENVIIYYCGGARAHREIATHVLVTELLDLQSEDLQEAAARSLGSPGRLRRLLTAAMNPVYRKTGGLKHARAEVLAAALRPPISPFSKPSRPNSKVRCPSLRTHLRRAQAVGGRRRIEPSRGSVAPHP